MSTLENVIGIVDDSEPDGTELRGDFLISGVIDDSEPDGTELRGDYFTSDESIYMNDESQLSLQDDTGQSGPAEAASEDNGIPFYECPERRWEEPKVEQLITYSGNVRNYLMQGYGQEAPDRDMAAMLEIYQQPDSYSTASDRLRQACDIDKLLTAPPIPAGPQPYSTSAPDRVTEASLPRKDASPYTPLPSERHIRLLELLPGFGTKLQCLFHVVLLDEAKNQYEALSYTWDTEWAPGFTHKVDKMPEVWCNGIAMSVKPNLYNALMMLKYSDRSRTIWADALCINQRDLQERGAQVSLMSFIFRSAFRVIIWLGVSKEEADEKNLVTSGSAYRAFTGVCAVANAWLKRKGAGAHACFATHSLHIDEEAKQPPKLSASSKVWYDIFKLYKCRWFSRLWVVQEALLAQSANVVWGRCMISWELIGLVASIVRTNYSRLNLPWSKYFEGDESRAVPTGVLNAYFMYRISESQEYSDPLRYSFHQLLSLTRQFNCLDPRDRMYGLLGLQTTDKITQTIVPDYSKTTTQLYVEITRQIIHASDSLNIFSSVQQKSTNGHLYHYWNPRGSDFDRNAPSWVPQWHFVLSRSLAPLTQEVSFNASGRMSMDLQESRDGQSLTVKGVIIGKTRNVSWPGFNSFWRGEQPGRIGYLRGEKRSEKTQSALDRSRVEPLLRKNKWTLAELERLAMTLSGGKNWYGLPVADIDAHLADFAKCLLKDGLLWALMKPELHHGDDCLGYESLNEDEDEHEHVPDGALPGIPVTPVTQQKSGSASTTVNIELLQKLAVPGSADRFLDAARTTCERRARFTVHDQETCIGPEAMDADDLVCVFYGADMPFVIRPKESAFLLIGECYVYGLMHGEAVRAVEGKDSRYEEGWIKLV